MTFVIPANCQVKVGPWSITFSREMRGQDPLSCFDVVELNGVKPKPDSYMPPELLLELQAMLAGRHPKEMVYRI